MFLTGFPAGPWGTNCYVAASGPNSECVVVDPGMQAVEQLRVVIEEHHLRPVAVLLSHGHLDHTWSVVPVADGYGIPAYIHAADSDRLRDAETLVGPDLQMMLRRFLGGEQLLLEPDDLRVLSDGDVLELAGLTLRTAHAPGHTAGSILFSRDAEGDVPPVVFSGDVLFAGSIGRTDLPGGDHAAMIRTLRDVILPLPDEAVVLPGHGPETTIKRERATNPYLRDVMRDAELSAPPRKGM